MVKEPLDDLICKALHNAQNGVRFVLHYVIEQVMLCTIRNDVIGEIRDDHVANYFKSDPAADELLERLLTSTSFMQLITRLVRRRMVIIMENNKYSTALESKELMDSVKPSHDGSDSLQSCSEYGSREPP